MSRLDLLLVNPGAKRAVYQGLGAEMAAVEPPYWAAALAARLWREGVSCRILDANALNLSPEEVAAEAGRLDPRLAAVIVYGSQPSASTQMMGAAGAICRALRAGTDAAVALGGLHPTALPERTLAEEAVDFVIAGEGHATLAALVAHLRGGGGGLDAVPGLWYREGGAPRATAPAPLSRDLDEAMPRAAWDLLPMGLYRAHNWHCFDDLEHRSPYAALYTSLGCPYGCAFCCINALFGRRGIRYRSPAAVLDELEHLARDHGVRNVKFIDELFVLDERHYLPIVDGCAERGLDLNIWAYARVDTVRPDRLERLRRGGVRWLALGIESADPAVRDGSAKAMGARDIRGVVESIRAAGIRVIGNYIFGLPDDTADSMRATLDLALELECEFANFYCAMAYPGSALYRTALAEGWELPDSWLGYSQHAYETKPLPTRHLPAREVLRFRDEAFHTYFTHPPYLDRVERTFGAEVRRHVEGMTGTRLRRRLLGD